MQGPGNREMTPTVPAFGRCGCRKQQERRKIPRFRRGFSLLGVLPERMEP